MQERIPTLTNQQRGVFDEVTTSTTQNTFDAKCFFIESCGGCGKTYLNNLLLAYVHSKGYHAIAVASSGIASLLLDDGTTGHSAFGIPVTKGGTSSIPLESTRASFLRDCKLIVWDEAPMADNDCFRVLDELLRDIMRQVDDALHVVPFGGETVVMTGDWRQILPVVPRGSRAAIVASTLKKNYFWPYFKTLRLTTNIRVEGTDVHAHQETRAFSNWLLDVGEGKLDNPLSVPPDMLLPEDTMESMVDLVFPTMGREELISGCILAPLNRATDSLNLAAVERLAGEEYVYTSADYFGSANRDDANIYPPELLNKLQPQGMPPHELKLKVGAPIILLRNLNRAEGLMNGTRLIVKACLQYNIQAEIVTGARNGRVVLLPRMNLTCRDTQALSISFVRRQYPVRLAFALTINRSQGQSFDRVGLLLHDPVFAYGQLYVALSRATARNGIRVIIGERA